MQRGPSPPAGTRRSASARTGRRARRCGSAPTPPTPAGPPPSEANAAGVVLPMIETPQGLANVEAIASTPGVDGLYIGPSDLTLAVGGADPADPAVAAAFEAALVRIRGACEANGITAGLHTRSGDEAAKRISEGFTM